MQHSIKDLWLYPFPEIDVVHTQEPLLPEPELTTPGRCICCRQNVRHRFRLDDSWPLRQLTDTISDTRVRLNKATEHLDKLKKRGEPVATGEKEKYNTAVKAAERALEQARLSARRLSLRHVQKAEITSTESLSEKEQELFHEDGPPYSLCAFCHAWHSLNGYAAAQGVMVWLLPSPLASLMSDDTWLWPSVPGTPALSAGDWPVMDTDPSTLRRVRRRSFSIIDNRNRKGYITRRYQCFPLAPLPEDRKYDSLPDLVLHPEQETIKCKEKHYSQPL